MNIAERVLDWQSVKKSLKDIMEESGLNQSLEKVVASTSPSVNPLMAINLASMIETTAFIIYSKNHRKENES